MIPIETYSLLLDYVLHLDNPKENRERLEKARPFFDTLDANDVMNLVDEVLTEIDDIEKVKIIVTRLLHSFSNSINRIKRDFERTITPIEELLSINDRINDLLLSCSNQLKKGNRVGLDSSIRETLIENVVLLKDLIAHYKIKEYRLFPLVERYIKNHSCVSLMWAIHDDIRATIEELITQLHDENSNLVSLNKTFGSLFFDMKSMIMREEQILYPVMIGAIPRNELLGLNSEQFEQNRVDSSKSKEATKTIDLITGNPTIGQIIQIFNHLNVDITYIDKDDKVVYFNTPEHRFFHRSRGVIGREVKNCHPPASVHIVEKILNAFKDGSKNEAEFVITMKGKRVRILYKAVRDSHGTYEGTLEISQEIGEIMSLGEDKRLLDWT